jgi:hypothetical protein
MTLWPSSLSDHRSRTLVADGARLARLSYKPDAELRQLVRDDPVFRRMVADDPVYIDCESCDAQGWTFTYDDSQRKSLCIVVCGTTSIEDWLCNVSIMQRPFRDFDGKPFGCAMVHAGFDTQADAMFVAVRDRVVAYMDAAPERELVCIGHSLGAAVSAVLALRIATRYPRRVTCVGYGTPRVGNSRFAAFVSTNLLAAVRVKNGSDPVCACVLPVNYEHAGVELHVGHEDPLPDVPQIEHLSDHYIDNYVSRLQRARHADDAECIELVEGFDPSLDARCRRRNWTMVGACAAVACVLVWLAAHA